MREIMMLSQYRRNCLLNDEPIEKGIENVAFLNFPTNQLGDFARKAYSALWHGFMV